MTDEYAPKPAASVAFDRATEALGLGIEAFWFNQCPAEQASRLSNRIKMSAKLLAKTAELQHSKALEAMAQALRFPSWHHLAAHLTRGQGCVPGQLPAGWLDGLSSAAVLLVQAQDDVSLPAAQLDAFEHLGDILAMLTDAPKQVVLDGVSAALCGGRSWREVRSRGPLTATEPLYRFVVPGEDFAGEVGGYFEESPACGQLIEQLDEQWQGYDGFSRPQKRKARAWVEAALGAQPGFLEGGLALASMQQDARDSEAMSTANRFVRQAEALIPKGFNQPIVWGHLGNRFYHRLLWLQLKLYHGGGNPVGATKLAKKQLKLNPNDNLGLRHVIPLLLLQQGEAAAARRALKRFSDEPGLDAAAIRAFVEFADGNQRLFQYELLSALFSWPWLRVFLLGNQNGLPSGDDGIRAMSPDPDTLLDFGWPAYCAVPGLRAACKAFLVEPGVLQAEAELRQYWASYWHARRDAGAAGKGTREGWDSLVNAWICRLSGINWGDTEMPSSLPVWPLKAIGETAH